MGWLTSVATDFIHKIDFNDHNLHKACAAIALQPTIWTIICRNEYHNRTLTNLFGNKHVAVACLSLIVLAGGRVRDTLVFDVMKSQATLDLLQEPAVHYAGMALMAAGGILVATSSYKLGWRNVFMGDYFDIFLPGPVTTFPYTISSNPMYLGSTLAFLGKALYHASPAGVFLTGVVWTVYKITELVEEPFTAMIYSDKAKRDAAAKSS